jgi:hypothetical protein
MPEIQCKTCKRKCGFLTHSQHNMNFLTSWARNQTMPVCDLYEEETYHGIDGVYS